MKKIYKTSAKVWMTILCSLCAVLMLTGMVGTVVMAEYGVYENGGSTTVSKRLTKRAGDAYALWAVANYHGGELDGDVDISFEGTGFKYAIAKVDDGQEEIVDRNFTGELPSDYQTAEFYVGSRPAYTLSNRLITGSSYWHGETTTQKNINVQAIGYDLIDNRAYIWDGEQFYPVMDEFAYAVEADYYDDENDNAVNTAFVHLWRNQIPTTTDDQTVDYNYYVDEGMTEDNTTYVIEDDNAVEEQSSEDGVIYDYLPTETIGLENPVVNGNLLYIKDRGYHSMADAGWKYVLYIASWEDAGGLDASNVADLSEIHDELCKLKTSEVKLKKPTLAEADVTNSDNAKYTVYYYTENQPDMQGGFFHGNLFTQAAVLGGLIPVASVLCPLAMIVFLLVAIWLLFLLFLAAGHRYGEEGIMAGKLERVPMDLMLAIAVGLELAVLGVVCAIEYGITSTDAYYTWFIAVVAVAAFVGGVIGICWLMTVAVNVKMGHWWQNTLIYKLLQVLKVGWSRICTDARAIRRTVRWDIRAWLLFALFVFLEGFGLVAFNAGSDLVLVWFFEKVLFGFLLFQLLKHYAKLKNSVVQMAEGDMNVQIDTKGMPLDFEEHGEALNKISSGMTTAVTERIKSERMKTELITNVSHDIKTPLTSIINYVDLLQKEQINNETAKGYLEVLDRQAKRLKKLIEDLIEASKAATGNIKFHMESVNANTLLNQSIGEFEEKLEANQITLVTNMPEEEIHLWADNRYLWRVFDNIMNNIAKYAQPGTRAYVDLKDSNDKVTFTFRNTSKNELNISADELMERFVRGDASRNTEGNGLGLSIARSLTESMDGTMSLAIDGDLFKVILEFKKN